MTRARVAATGPVAPLSPADVESAILEVFARRSAAHRDRLALAMGARELRYADLDVESSHVARCVQRECEAEEPGRVVLLIDDRVRQVVALLGVLKAGHAFVPLDPSQPPARLRACLSDAEPCAILCESRSHALAQELAQAAGLALPVIDVQREGAAEAGGALANVRTPRPDDAAYLLYTSGSTGEPKGVVQTHRNVLHNVAKLTTSLALTPADRISMLGNAVFAFSMSDIFGALLSGAALLPYDVRNQGVDGLAGWIAAEEITLWSSVPTLFRHALSQSERALRFPSVRLLKLAGEPVRRRDVECFRRHFPHGSLLLNSLGATELNTIRQLFVDHDTPLPSDAVPVGYAVDDTDVLILDPQGMPLPPGHEGEIAIRSPFLSPGYWKRPEQTARAFVADPEGGPLRVLRSGDLGRIDADCLSHFGRLDGQLRIRGHRVETAEIESALLAHAEVRAAAVVARTGASGDTELVAWLASHKKRAPDAKALRASLARRLPDYMLPARYAVTASLPLLPSGKVDRLKLAGQPLPDTSPRRAAQVPRDPIERKLAALWCIGLRLQEIGRDDDFFELGGHSLVAARIVARIQHEFGRFVPLTLFRDAPTVAQMALHLQRGVEEAQVLVELQPGEASLPLVVVPGAGSDAFKLQDLARALGPDQGVFALQMPGLLPGERPPPESVEALAALYLAELHTRQPHGPYALAGESFGGVVAFEMARALHAAGERVALLALLDTYAPGHPRRRPGLGPRAWPRLAGRWLLPRGKKELRTPLNLRRGLREKLETLRFRAHRLRHGADAALPYAWRYTYQRELCFAVQNRYQLRAYAGPLQLLRAEQQAPADLYVGSDDLGWRPFVKGAFEVHDVPGRHGDALRAPHVSRTARILREALRAARREIARP